MQQIERQTTVMLSSLLGEAVPFDFLVAASADADPEVRVLDCVALGGLADQANPAWLIPLLTDRDIKVSYYATHELLPYGNRVPLEGVLEALIKNGIDGSNDPHKDPLAQVLGSFKERFPRSILESLVKSDAEVAAAILGELGDAAPTDLLDAILAVPFRQSTRPIRFEALAAAKKLKNPLLTSRLASIMRDEEDFSRFAAAAALGATGDQQYRAEILSLFPIADRSHNGDFIADGLAGYGEQMPVEEMVEFIRESPRDYIRESPTYYGGGIGRLIGTFQSAGRHTPYEFLMSYATDTDRDPQARGHAAEVLGWFARSGLATTQQFDVTIQTLVELLRAEHASVLRYIVAFSLGLIQDAKTLETLVEVVSAPGEDSRVAVGAAEGLLQLAVAGLHAPVEMWKTLLDNTADVRRKYAIRALGQRDDAPSELLLNYFADSHLKELVHKQLLLHPPSNALDLAKTHLALLASEESDPLCLAADRALTSLEEASDK